MKTIVIIGRPNVGKSTLFNRIVGKKAAIVDDTPGVTRDWKEEIAVIFGRKFRLIDTAGLEKAETKSLEELMMKKTEDALNQADILLMLVDGTAGVTEKDLFFVKWLRKKNKQVILLVNKCERADADITEFYKLGLGEPIAISAEHKLGIADLFQKISEIAGEPLSPDEMEENEEEIDYENDNRPIQIAIIGRPNAGKSTIVNKILKQDRVITSPIAGTTRDAISVDWEYKGRKIRLIDTAGMRRRANISEQLEKFSVSDAINAVKFAHVVILVSDATEVMENQDLKIADLVIKEGRALVMAVNKWDLIKDKKAFSDELEYLIRKQMNEVIGLEAQKFSALNDSSLDKLLDAAIDAYNIWNTRIPTNKLNDWLSYLLEHHPPPISRGRRIKIRYLTQVKARPPTFMLSCSQPDDMPDSYLRYLTTDLRKVFNMPGTPLRIQMPKKTNPFKGKKSS